MNVLVINCGSSSLKYQLINSDSEEVLAKGLCERIGIDGRLVYQKEGMDKEITEAPMPTHKEAIQMVLDALHNPKSGAVKDLSEIDAVGHRVVHGGEKFAKSGAEEGFDTMRYSRPEVERIAHVGFRTAMQRRKHLTCVDKSNVLETSQLWREVVTEVSKQYPEVKLDYLYVDNAAMQLVRAPTELDVVLTGNLFGDILSDEAAMLTGSIGMLASASLNEKGTGLFEPSHGSAPDIAGKNIANPIATVESAAMMIRYAFHMDEQADRIEAAIRKVLSDGIRTGDIWSEGCEKVSCSGMGDAIRAALR